jgi:hypothetical protein
MVTTSPSGRVIRLLGFRIDKHGFIVRNRRRLDVPTRLRRGKRVRVAKKGQAHG